MALSVGSASTGGSATERSRLLRYATILLALSLVGCKDNPKPNPQIIFSSKAFYDAGKAAREGIIYIAGTLTGPDVGYPNNTTAVICYADRMECLAYSVEQIGPNQIGRLDMPMPYPVIKWDSAEVVAMAAFQCAKVTISIVRQSESLLWVTEPINQSRAQCKNANTKILKWTIEDSPAWKAMFQRKD
jgi:hypothetical protein